MCAGVHRQYYKTDVGLCTWAPGCLLNNDQSLPLLERVCAILCERLTVRGKQFIASRPNNRSTQWLWLSSLQIICQQVFDVFFQTFALLNVCHEDYKGSCIWGTVLNSLESQQKCLILNLRVTLLHLLVDHVNTDTHVLLILTHQSLLKRITAALSCWWREPL